MTGNVFSWTWGKGIGTIIKQFFTYIIDFLHSAFWSIIHLLATICDGIYKIINYIISPEALELFTKDSAISKFYTASFYLGMFLVLLFAAWQIFKTYIEPDKAPPLSSILWETVKCIITISMFLMIFNTSLSLVSKLQNTIPAISSNSKVGYDSSGQPIYVSNNDDVKFSSFIISSFITLPKNEKITSEDLISALNREPGSCNEDGISFWGCEYTNYKLPTKFSLYWNYDSKYRKEINSSSIDEDNENVAPMYNWRDTIESSLLTKANHRKNYVFATSKALLLVSIILFSFALCSLSFSLATRIFELLVTLVIAPAIIGTSVCRQETRITLYKSLASLLLQSVGTILTFYLSISFMTTISGMDASKIFGGNVFLVMLLKCVLIFGIGMFMIQGSKQINAFISESAGMKNGIMGGLATVAAVAGAGRVAAAGLGVAAKIPSGLSSASHAAKTKMAGGGVAGAERKYRKSGSQQDLDNLASKIERYDKAKESGNKYTPDGLKKNNFSNKMSALGDRLMGKKPTSIAPKTSKQNKSIERARSQVASSVSNSMRNNHSNPSDNISISKTSTNGVSNDIRKDEK